MENKELLEKARQANSPEELLALAKENDYELDEEGAKAYFEQLHTTGELSDDELDNVAGGGCYNGGRLVVTKFHNCKNWICKKCGGDYQTGLIRDVADRHFCKVRWTERNISCLDCKYCSYEKALWLCNHPANRK